MGLASYCRPYPNLRHCRVGSCDLSVRRLCGSNSLNYRCDSQPGTEWLQEPVLGMETRPADVMDAGTSLNARLLTSSSVAVMVAATASLLTSHYTIVCLRLPFYTHRAATHVQVLSLCRALRIARGIRSTLSQTDCSLLHSNPLGRQRAVSGQRSMSSLSPTPATRYLSLVIIQICTISLASLFRLPSPEQDYSASLSR